LERGEELVENMRFVVVVGVAMFLLLFIFAMFLSLFMVAGGVVFGRG